MMIIWKYLWKGLLRGWRRKDHRGLYMVNQVFDDVHCEDCVNDSVCYIDRDFISAVNCHVDRDFVRVDNEFKYETDHFVENGDLY